MDKSRICNIEGCGKAVKAWEWCSAHYKRWKCYGSPLAGGTFRGQPLRWVKEVALKYNDDDCLVWPFARDANGYGKVWYNGRLHLVTRVVCEEVYGPPPTPKHEAAHSCGNGRGGCANWKHLRWATRAENESDKILHGTLPRGERQWFSKLTEAQVLEIRKMAGTSSEIAAMFGVSRRHISDIKALRSWAWLVE